MELAAEAVLAEVTERPATLDEQRALNVLGPAIVDRWQQWMRGQPHHLQLLALAELADLPVGRAQALAVDVLRRESAATLDATLQAWTLRFLCVIPRCAQQLFVTDPYTGDLALPAAHEPDQASTLLAMLPFDGPPLPPDTILSETQYWLGEVHAAGEVGTSYKAAHAEQPDQALSAQFCLDPALLAPLRGQRVRLEKLRRESTAMRSERCVELTDFDLDRERPVLIRPYTAGVSLTRWLWMGQRQSSRGLDASTALQWITWLAEALADLHRREIVHQDVKPANVLLIEDTLRLAGSDVGPALAAAAGGDESTAVEQVRLQQGAATRRYLAPEQRGGASPDPSQDVHSLGVTWYQMLLGDVTCPMTTGWKEKLGEVGLIPEKHLRLLEQCVAPRAERISSGMQLVEMLGLLSSMTAGTLTEAKNTVISGEEVRAKRRRQHELLCESKQVLNEQDELEELDRRVRKSNRRTTLIAFVAAAALAAVLLLRNSIDHWLLAAIPIIFVVVGTLIYRRTGRVRKLRQQIDTQLQELKRRYPEEIQSWGGDLMLYNVDLLREMVRALETDAGILSIP